MISSDSCSQLVAGKYDVIVNEPSLRSILTDFLDRFHLLEANLLQESSDCGYASEFKLLKEFSKTLKEDKANLQEGEQEFNLKKNRYKDIIPFSHTRVVLNNDPLIPGSSYINANYIRGPSGASKAYIACQGPLACTLVDFWRMIWETRVSVIIMACNENESGKPKCELYWPEQVDSTQVYGNIEITLKDVRQICSDFLVRKFSVKLLSTNCIDNGMNHHDVTITNESEIRLNGQQFSDVDTGQARNVIEKRIVCQFHYTTWPDHGVPDSVHPILELVRLVREVQPAEDKPILVHCSAGCGRTGTICCIDFVWGQLRRGKLDPSFDLCNIISEMRQQRMAMVQTLEQYILCHRAVAALFINQLKLIDDHTYENLDPNVDDRDEAFDNQDFGSVLI